MNKKNLLVGTLTGLMYYVTVLKLLGSKDNDLPFGILLSIFRIFKNFYE